MFIGAIADDLTGATDLALMLARGGLRVTQLVGLPDADFQAGDAQAVVVSLKTRTIAADEAVAQSVAAAKTLLAQGAEQLFFKYCSTFDSTDRGNIGPVIDALMTLCGTSHTIACPAFPANGRTVYRGHLFVGDELLSDSSMRDHPLTPMRDANLVRVLARQSVTRVSLVANDVLTRGADALKARFDELDGIAIVDAITDEDLKTIGEACRGMKLITGGSGLAIGLPRNFVEDAELAPLPETMNAPPGRCAILAGSCSTMTRRQVEFAEKAEVPTLPISAMAIASGEIVPEHAVEFVLAQGENETPVVYSSATPEAVRVAQDALGREKAGEIVETFMAEVASALCRRAVSRLIVAGGETSGAISAALGLKALKIGPEIAPGVPWTLADGPAGPLALALKSGNFGNEDFFLKAWEHLQ
ncbi:HPr kinase [Devosia pacifica]|uniref:3-oxo-tetronate kinase n=1 Tax=Devosia pacifica TaxID=1335967 RepID=A0A918VY82_9HYPH|nr:3-oxo-tetronate kinase [Devosia pacifica]GHA36185.1 HPr kinase [Devosia pacifica]